MMHIVKYRWDSGEPVMVVAERGELHAVPVMDHLFAHTVGERRCIGYMRSGKHVPCPDNAAVDGGWYCEPCVNRDSFFLCVRCDGSDCKNEKRREQCKKEKYYIYLSAFGPVLKVGISNQFRLVPRLVEQGADMAARIALVQGGKEARLLEQHIKACLNIVDRVDGLRKHQLLGADPNAPAVRIAAALEELKEAQLLVDRPAIYDLRSFYRLDRVRAAPSFLQLSAGQDINGTVVAAKGNLLILENSGAYSSFNAHELIGRTITS